MTRLASTPDVPAARWIGQSFVRPATVLARRTDGAYDVRLEGEEPAAVRSAELATDLRAPLGAGDRVLVTGENPDSAFIIGVLGSTAERRLTAKGGATVAITEHDGGERLEVRDAEARLLFAIEPATGRAVLSVPAGDLELRAPNGDIRLEAKGTVRCGAEAGIELEAPAVSVSGDTARIAFRQTTFRGRTFTAAIADAKLVASRLESVTERILQRTKSLFSHVEDLHQLRAGRARTVVEGGYHLKSGHASIEADDDVRIDGRQIHLG